MPAPSGDEATCAYCGKRALTGKEEPEHVLPAAIDGRLTTKAVGTPCNHWAGKNIDQPWLAEPQVVSARFWQKIPDRRGKILSRDPLLTGVADDDTRVTMGRDGTPVPLNSLIKRDADGTAFGILAKDSDDLERLIEREKKKAEAAGKTFQRAEPEVVSRQPKIVVEAMIYPARWERMGAKVLLGLLAETQPAGRRAGPSADLLRERMRDMARQATAVRLSSAEAFAVIAAPPASVAVVRTVGEHVIGQVSLMGIHMVGFVLCEDLRGVDLCWVSDPLEPARSFLGPLAEVIGRRQGLL